MYVDYCLSCRKEVDDGRTYCNEECEKNSAGRSQSQTRGNRLRSLSDSSDGQESSWLSGLSDISSNPSSRSSRSSSVSSFSYYDPSGPSSPRKDWNRPTYDVVFHRQLLADLDLTGNVTKLDQYPFECGGSADLYRGMLSPRSGPVQQVAVKVFRRMHAEPKTLEQTCKSLYREARIWKRLNHPNILPFLGISLDLGLSPALISPLCESGHVMKSLHNCSEHDEKRLEMAIGVASGLAYLSSQSIVHGNLCTKKILINAAGSPVICGYGMSKTIGQAASATSLFTSSIRFTAPECFSDKGNVTSASADIYSLSMVTLEILSGLQPYHELSAEHAIFMHVIRGGRPSRAHLDKTVITSRIWKFLVSAWNQEPSPRPDAAKFLADLIQIRRLHGLDDTEEIDEAGASQVPRNENEERSSSGEEIFFEDMSLPDLHGRDLTGRVVQDDKHPFAGGGNANIYRGKLIRSGGRKIRVAIKLLRVSEDATDVMRRLRREVEVWSKLKHKNVLPFIGVCNDIAPYPVLISPFYKSGHVETYVKKNPSVNKHALVHGVASGLQYLHENDIVHGDLKVQNVLVDKRGAPCICDFGISKIINRRGFTTFTNGTAPYMAPELFFVIDAKSQDSASPSTTKQSDVYSFALLALEILTSAPPKGRPKRPIVTEKALMALRPKRADYSFRDVSSEMWSVLDHCWAFVPQWRPTISEVLDSLSADELNSSGVSPYEPVRIPSLIPIPVRPVAKNRLIDPQQRSRISDSWSSDDSQRSGLVQDDSQHSLLRRRRIEAEQQRRDEIRDAYARLKNVLPVCRDPQTKICLLERARDHIRNLHAARRQLETRLEELEKQRQQQVQLHEVLRANIPGPGSSFSMANASHISGLIFPVDLDDFSFHDSDTDTDDASYPISRFGSIASQSSASTVTEGSSDE
ncbi:Glycoside hydrolase family 76 protein [Mycena sanguinolenta]|uniref:Glycoside hydrolase family 76 protein n=1 Tax=Mycena sanguinolenta TaxID=230812 RepID=A0A8H7CH16_9AGAR|nr:Glycoside hydrolase family 76 protein [Mycena sanguinolenta]